MPPWLRGVARANPLTYLVDALRDLMSGVAGAGLAVDVAVMAATLAALTALAAWLYPTLVR
jgi:ABC-2 type transport system permease protein